MDLSDLYTGQSLTNAIMLKRVEVVLDVTTPEILTSWVISKHIYSNYRYALINSLPVVNYTSLNR